MRKKTLIYDGLELTIAPLSLEQAEIFLNGNAGDNMIANTERMLELVVIPALNNANPQDAWTLERGKKEFDLYLLNQVFTEVLTFSGLKTIDLPAGAGDSKRPGEPKASVS